MWIKLGWVLIDCGHLVVAVNIRTRRIVKEGLSLILLVLFWIRFRREAKKD